MTPLYPLRFQPVFRRYLWGGRRLATELGKPIGAGNDYAESWEVVDHGADQSVVAAGPCAGLTLNQLVDNHALELLGRHAGLSQFPLLVKMLDAHRTLSVQVHPNDARAARLTPPDQGKTEAWVILAAEPGSRIYAGLKPGIDRATLTAALEQGAVETCLHQFEPTTGDCIFIPAGTVHALGAGLLVAEIQQSSDTTYRLFDWNRVGSDGQPRALHIESGLEAIDYRLGPISAQTPRPTNQPGRERLIECDQFVIDRVACRTPPLELGGDERFHVVCSLAGQVDVAGDLTRSPLQLGQTCLLPAALGPTTFSPASEAVLLDVYLP